MAGGVNISLYSCVQGLIQDLNLDDDMNVSSCWSIINVKIDQADRSFAFCF